MGSQPIARALRSAGLYAKDGIAAVEFAIFAPLFLVVLASIVDVGNLLWTQFQLDASVASGAQYAIVNNGQVGSTQGATLASSIASIVASSPAADTVKVVVNNGPTVTITGGGSPASSGTAANADLFYCPSGTPGSWTFGTGAAVGGVTCPGGSGMYGAFVTISASKTVTTFLPVGFYGAVFGASLTMKQNAIVETK